jgi:hypothetical protein
LYDWTSGLIKSQSSGYCLGATGFRIVDSEVLLWNCDDFSRSQQWSLWNAGTLQQDADSLAVKADRARPRLDSLFCVTLCGSAREGRGNGSITATLLREMETARLGIFACEEFAVYSNPVIKLGSYRTSLLNIDLAPLASSSLGETALIYEKLWDRVVADGRYAFHAWTVKVAPDAVFLPARLREALRGPGALQEPQSGNGLFLQSCQRALGLYGALEVLSRRAVEAFVEGRERCTVNETLDGASGFLKELPKEAASFLQSCLLRLGTTRVEQLGLLAASACGGGEDWSPCTSRAVAFHPFDTVATLRQCFAAAAGKDKEAHP